MMMNNTAIGISPKEFTAPIPPIKEIPTSLLFVGYTEFALDDDGQSLINIPKKISCFEEFEQYFGKAKRSNFVATMSSQDSRSIAISEIENNPFTLYYSIQNFFKNNNSTISILSLGHFSEIKKPNVQDFEKALEIIDQYEDFSVLAFSEMQYLPNEEYATFVAKTLEICKNKNRFFIIDLPYKEVQNISYYFEDFRELLGNISPDFLTSAAAYFPSLETKMSYSFSDENVAVRIANQEIGLQDLQTSDPQLYSKILLGIKSKKVILPPSSCIANVYLKNDAERGIWNAPSILPLLEKALFYSMNDVEQAKINSHSTGKSINSIRNIPGKGTLVWGARTLNGNNSEFRYINVVRFVKMLKASILKSLDHLPREQWTANNGHLVLNVVNDFLHHYWQLGALQGLEPSTAYYVNCKINDQNSDFNSIEKNINIDFGIAIFRPAEFINISIDKKIMLQSEN